MKKTTLLSLGILALSGVAASTSFAHDNACSADVQKLCPDAKTWKDKGACLKQHESELSTGCADARKKRKAKWEAKKAEFHKACDADIQKQCSNIPDGKGKPWETIKCLKSNENSLSDSCKAELGKMHGHHHKKSQQNQ